MMAVLPPKIIDSTKFIIYYLLILIAIFLQLAIFLKKLYKLNSQKINIVRVMHSKSKSHRSIHCENSPFFGQ